MAEAKEQDDARAFEEALSLLRDGRVEQALTILLALAPHMPRALGEIAYTYHARGDNEKALEFLSQYVQRVPQDPSGWALLARIALEQNDLEQAERHVRRAVALQPQNAAFWFEMGEVLLRARKWAEAARAYRRCLRLDPQFSRARVRRTAAARMAQRNRIRAITWWGPVSGLLQWVLSWGLWSALLEETMGITLHDRRWILPLEMGAMARGAPACPKGQEPDVFQSHFAQCRCPFWQWFLSLTLDGPIRRIVEIGSGPGHVAHHFACRGFEVLSITPSELARLDRERRAIAAVRGDMHFFVERGATQDFLLANRALQSSRAPVFALAEWKRLLRPDGYLVVLERLMPSPGRDIDPPEPHALVGYTYWQLRWLFKLAGFQILAEILEDPEAARLESTEHVGGRRRFDPAKSWNAFFLLRKPGKLPYDGLLERPRPMAGSASGLSA